ncbi:putative AfsR-family transcriptional regulator [Actinoplanes missouriensis 431]|uniref:Putative AfsR-family transcriptional regulator n=1 Tax=Actinoplanes missouriensis (strain ATCC 14538 / DSM 43046 / CBS 188.64 / JCM 3121 / NBRC 102363 / NCIMB 12654 / NRRL B-3342 / UNCC 431) TaxID=512565 RepID=I0H3T8_ACTM4|nr:helix-turn-helix domain-containing protein [Actinoplanes missouriensis]BAL87675.1 putative AfsR-family transcriptional regulator [Actinoplanes missouriensis 431]
MSEFGAHLRGLRQAAGLTMEQLAEASGVSARAISDMERGHSRAPQARTLAALADGLGLDAAQTGALREAAQGQRTSSAGRPRICELPRSIGDFVGRTPELALLTARAGGDATGPAPVVVVHGQAGLGKTTLALRAAEDVAGDFPDGQFYLDLRGTDPEPVEVGEALLRLLRAMDVSPRRIAETDEERSSQLRAVLRDRRCLLVLDNAGSEAQVRPLLPDAGAGFTIVTSRRVLGGLEGVLRIALGPLQPAESASLLRGIAEQAAAPKSWHAVDAVARLCGHLPLALRIAGTRLATRPTWTVETLQDRLADTDRRLATLQTGDLGVAAAFALSHAQLSAPAKALFRRLAHVPGVDFAPPLASVLTGTGLDEVTDGLDELVELGLLLPEGVERYRFHDLIRLFAEQQLRNEESAGVRSATHRSMVDWLLQTAIVAGRWFEPAYGRLPDGWAGLVPLATMEQASDWLRDETDNWIGALRSAAADGRHQLVVDVAEALHWYSDKTVRRAHWYDVYRLSRAAASALPDRRQEAVHINYLSWAATHCARRPDEGADVAMQGHRLAVELGDVKEQAWALRYAGDAWRNGGQSERALGAYRQACRLADQADDHDGYVQLRPAIAMMLNFLGRHDEALTECAAALREIDARPVAPRPALSARICAHAVTARALADAGRWTEALHEAERAMPMATEFGYGGYRGELHLTMGRARVALGLIEQARPDLTRAVELLAAGSFRNDEKLARAALAALDA